MKKRIFALMSALVLTFGMSVSVFAAGSADAGTTVTAVPVDSEITQDTADALANATELCEAPDGTTFKAVTAATANVAKEEAKKAAGSNAAIATVVDLIVPAGTEKASFTLALPAIKGTDSVLILHQKSDGTWETINPDSVADGKVSFTMTSFSPVAVVIKAAAVSTGTVAVPAPTAGAAAPAAATSALIAPKTGDVLMAVAFMAVICLAGTVVSFKKAAN